MDCNGNQSQCGVYSNRPQMPPPPCMNTNCCSGYEANMSIMACGSNRSGKKRETKEQQPPELPQMIPEARIPSCGGNVSIEPLMRERGPMSFYRAGQFSEMMPGWPGVTLPGNESDAMPIAMAYVPWQQWDRVYPTDQALERGTLFPDLDLPFVMGRCR